MKNILYKISYLTFLILFIPFKSYSQFGWYPLNSGTTQNLNSLYGNFIVGDSGIILKSTNYGINWIRTQSPTTKNLNSIWYDSRLLIAGDSGLVLISYNSGNSWNFQNTGTNKNLNSIKSYGSVVIAVGNDGVLIKSTNSGSNWSLIDCGTNLNLNYAALNSSGNFLVAGDNGLILKSTNGGSNWILIYSGTTSNLNYISYPDLISGNNGVVLKSTDVGNSWNSMNTGTSSNLRSMCLIGELAWAGGDNGTIIKSFDHGINWTQQNSGTNVDLNIVGFIDADRGWALGNSGLLLKHDHNTTILDSKKLDANQIRTWFRNNGSFNRDPQTGNAGFEWPSGSGLYARYAAGIWMGYATDTDTLTSVIQYGTGDFVNGYIDNSGNSQGYNDSNYRIYKITKGDSLSPDYLNWPAYQGAYLNSEGKPYFLGTQTMFYVYNDNYFRQSGFSSIAPMKAQILQTNWAYNRPGLLGNVIFTEYRIINRGSRIWNNFYFGIWNDDDVNCPCYGKTGCDTIRNLGYNYFTNTNDPQYGSNPPAIGNLFLNGLLKYTGNANDTVRYYNPPGSNNLITKAGYVNLKLRVCNRFNNSSYPPEPSNNTETYRVITGHRRNGESWINPVTNNFTTFVHPGDPVTNTGWIQEYTAYKRTFHGSGPATVNPGDTVSVLYAQLIARGSDNLNSITKLRETADYVQQIYDENFQSVVSIKNITSEIPVAYELFQNYPNPFNPVTHLEFGISKFGFVSLKVYDMLGKEVKTLVNEDMSAGRYVVEFDGSNLPSGIYFYRLNFDGNRFDTKKMLLLK